MGTMKQSLVAIGVLAILLGLGIAILVWRTGYSVSEMDWDSDGETSLGEMWRSIDVGRRPTKKDGMECQEFYSLKDGLPIRIVCPDKSESMIK